jgi:hypothetical protein
MRVMRMKLTGVSQMVFLAPIFFFGWKFLKKTKFVKPHEADVGEGVYRCL